jgi:tellurite resistance protein TehA-like permease
MTKTILLIGEGANAVGGHFLSLAASPTFAIMALLTGALNVGAPDVLCSTQHASPLDGMVLMFALMSAFHSAPWLKLISSRRDGVRRARSSRPAHLQSPSILS